jgi:mannose-6-phosphate isomerase-like protein (cupin superfamily)
MNDSGCRTGFCALAWIFLVSIALCQETQRVEPQAKVITLQSHGQDVTPVLSGPPETVAMRSGLVVLAPGKSVGKHSTQKNEELLVILDGEGEMIFSSGSKLALKANEALYCPPETEHNVTNTGTRPLRYVYVVARALPKE